MEETAAGTARVCWLNRAAKSEYLSVTGVAKRQVQVLAEGERDTAAKIFFCIRWPL